MLAAIMAEFAYTPLLPLAPDDTPYELLTTDHVELVNFGEEQMLKVDPEGLRAKLGVPGGRRVDAQQIDLVEADAGVGQRPVHARAQVVLRGVADRLAGRDLAVGADLKTGLAVAGVDVDA